MSMFQRCNVLRRTVVSLCVVGLALAFCPGLAAAQESGRIEGRVVRDDGNGVAGVSVVLNETETTVITGSNGVFTFANIVPGTYSVTMVLGANVVTVSVMQVSAGATTTWEETVDWDVGLTESLTITSATPARQVERLVEAPVAAAVVAEEEITRKASHGQLAKLLEYTPGAQLTQGDVGDFNFGTRGFNQALSRRVAVLIDGRDMSLPLLGSQYWANVSFPLDDLESVEFVRGPSAALFGANATGGVVNMTTKEPRFNQGGMARVAFGELNTVNLDTRWSGGLGNGWYTRVVAGRRDHDMFAVSRVDGPEYSVPCAPFAFTDCITAENLKVS